MKKILMSGGAGNLAKHIIGANQEYDIYAPTRSEMDVSSYDQVEAWIEKINPDIFLHCGAFTRPMNKHQKYPVTSIKTNIVGTSNVAMSCIKNNVKLVYISTDYVYPGTEGNYRENDPIGPIEGKSDGVSKYGWSKLGGECATRIHDNSLIIRACICNSPFPHPRAASDIKKSLMFDYEAAPIILMLLNETGIINVGGDSCTVYEFASKYNPSIEKIKSSEILDVKISPDTSMCTKKMKKIIEYY